LIPAVLKRQQELDGCWREERKAGKIEIFPNGSKYRSVLWFEDLVRDMDETEEDSDQTPEGKVDVEA